MIIVYDFNFLYRNVMSIQQVSPKIYLNNITVKNKTLIIFLFDNSFFNFDLTKAVLAWSNARQNGSFWFRQTRFDHKIPPQLFYSVLQRFRIDLGKRSQMIIFWSLLTAIVNKWRYACVLFCVTTVCISDLSGHHTIVIRIVTPSHILDVWTELTKIDYFTRHNKMWT